MPTSPSPTAFYCVSTHWDREWYEPFQEYRLWLVETLDRLIDLMESRPEFTHAHLDGQAVMVEDYLELRPENEARLVGLIRQGRISAGPWYVLPDEWLISGESYVRNFLTARATCRRYGIEPLDFCYTPDQFGHIAALPMIARGVGLTAGIVWRGTADETHAPHFLWEGPDGSQLPTHKLFDEAAYGWLFHKLRTMQGVRDYRDPAFHDMIQGYIEHERPRLRVPVMLILDGNDHQTFEADMIDLFEGMRTDYPDLDWRWAPLSELGKALAEHAAELPTFQGELREPARHKDRACQYLIVNVLSSRYNVKKENDACQALLERWAEPAALFQRMHGGQPIVTCLSEAWRHLVKNHPHDSICGCSIDQVHRDMQYRFDQARMLADGLTRRALAALATPAKELATPQCFTVHNPLPRPRRGVFECDLALPTNWPERYLDAFGSSEPISAFEVVTADGAPVPWQFSRIERNLSFKHMNPAGRSRSVGADVYHLTLDLDLPAAGHLGLQARPVNHPIRDLGSLRTGPLSAANEHFAFTLHTDGTGCLQDPASGRTYDNLFLYEDRADVGDGWIWGDLVADQVFITPGSRVTTGIVEDGSLRTVFRVEREFELPEAVRSGASEDMRRDIFRSPRRATLRVVDHIHVEKGNPTLRVRTTVENNIRDHRFRVGFPTNLKTDVSFAETPYAVVERDILPPAESTNWLERVNGTKAFTTFFGAQDGQAGLAVVAPFGLHEYEVAQSPDRALWVTLFRSTHRTVMTNGEPDGQLQGTLGFEYALVPFSGKADHAALARLAAEAQAGVRVYATDAAPAPVSNISVEGDGVVVTAMKPADEGDGGVIRLWNPGDAPADALIRLAKAPKAAWRCNLMEVEEGELAPVDGALPVTVAPGALATVKFAW